MKTKWMIGLTMALLVMGGSVTATDTAADARGEWSRTHQSILTMKHTGGWGTGVQAEFTLDADGGFRWRTKEGERSGVIPAAATRQLREEVSSAGAGPAAEDAGYVEFTWLDDGGKDGSQAYSHPGEAPCRRLLDRIEGLVKKHGAARADQGGAVRDGRAEPRDPAASR